MIVVPGSAPQWAHELAKTIEDLINSLRRGPQPLTSYTVANVPTAVGRNGAQVYITNETGGAVPAFSDGTNWRRVTDRAIIS